MFGSNPETYIVFISHVLVMFLVSFNVKEHNLSLPFFFFDIEIFKEYRPIELFQNTGIINIPNFCLPKCFLMNNHPGKQPFSCWGHYPFG